MSCHSHHSLYPCHLPDLLEVGVGVDQWVYVGHFVKCACHSEASHPLLPSGLSIVWQGLPSQLKQINCFNSLTNDKCLDLTTLKCFVDNKLTVAITMNSVFNKVENIVGKGEKIR